MSVVQPSADIKAIIEKTAAFVAKRGDAMEKRILSQDQSSSKLSFLRPQDPLNPYYRQLVLKLRKSSAQTASTETGTSASATATQTTNSTSDITKTTTNQKSDQDPGKSTKSVPAQTQQIQPPAKNKFTITPPHLTPFEIDLIKLTAMFTARNGDSFRDGLLSREQKDPQYDFLKPGSINYGYYAALVEQYKSTMLPARGISQTLRSEYATPQVVLKRLTDRATWENAQETARKNAEEEAEAERIAYAQIDWQDFVVVETINFDDDDDNNDELPAPKVADKETANANEEEEEEKEERTDNNEGDAEGKKKSEDGHRPGKKKKGKQLTQVCPICHLEIPVEEFSEHMRIELLDPNGKKQKELGIARAAQSALASGDEISANLARFARSRKDIFGLNDMQKDVLGDASKPIATAEDHTQEAPSVAQPPQPAPVPVPVPVPAPTKMGGQPLLPLQMPPAPPSLLPMIPGMMGMMPPPPQPPSLAQNTHQPPAQLQQQARVGEEEEKKEDKKGKDEGREAEPPVTKKQHIERTVVSLVTEETFLKENGGGATSANISVVMPPAADANKKAEYKRLGEVLKLSCTLSGTICDIKNMIREETNIPVNKQKLSIEGIGVLKDAYTLAFYNVSSVQNSKMTMKFKERGGKKK